MSCFVYILYSIDFDRFYIGQSQNPLARLLYHNDGFETSTAPYRPWKLVLQLEKTNRSEAMVLEKKLKNLNRMKLLKFIEKYNNQSS